MIVTSLWAGFFPDGRNKLIDKKKKIIEGVKSASEKVQEKISSLALATPKSVELIMQMPNLPIATALHRRDCDTPS